MDKDLFDILKFYFLCFGSTLAIYVLIQMTIKIMQMIIYLDNDLQNFTTIWINSYIASVLNFFYQTRDAYRENTRVILFMWWLITYSVPSQYVN